MRSPLNPPDYIRDLIKYLDRLGDEIDNAVCGLKQYRNNRIVGSVTDILEDFNDELRLQKDGLPSSPEDWK